MAAGRRPSSASQLGAGRRLPTTAGEQEQEEQEEAGRAGLPLVRACTERTNRD